MISFNSAIALRKYISTTKNIPENEMKFIQLSEDEKMLIRTDAPDEPLGFVTFTYQGIVPGRGKVWDIYARPA